MHCWARYLLIFVVSVLGVGHMIAACGQKGDLYLPAKEMPKAAAKGGDTPAVPTGDETEKEAAGQTAGESILQ